MNVPPLSRKKYSYEQTFTLEEETIVGLNTWWNGRNFNNVENDTSLTMSGTRTA